jgi:hypothetical protein
MSAAPSPKPPYPNTLFKAAAQLLAVDPGWCAQPGESLAS